MLIKKTEKAIWGVLALVPITILLVLFVIPAIYSVITSFQISGGKLTLKNYDLALRLYARDITFSLGVSLVGVFITLVLAILVAAYVYTKHNNFIEWLFKIPLFVPFVVVGHAFRILLAPHGLLNLYLSQVGIINLNDPPDYAGNWIGLSIALAWKNIGLSFLLIIGAFKAIDKNYLDAAKNLGAKSWNLIKDILVPMSFRQIAIVSVLIFTSMLASFNIPIMLSGETARMIMVDIYYNIVYVKDMGVANALGVISYFLSLIAAIYYVRSVKVK